MRDSSHDASRSVPCPDGRTVTVGRTRVKARSVAVPFDARRNRESRHRRFGDSRDSGADRRLDAGFTLQGDSRAVDLQRASPFHEAHEDL